MSDNKDYYETLGVERSADADALKRAYRRLARKYHPDVSKEANAEARFKEVGEEGAQLERDLVAKAEEYGMRIIGPNCLGVMSPMSEYTVRSPTGYSRSSPAMASRTSRTRSVASAGVTKLRVPPKRLRPAKPQRLKPRRPRRLCHQQNKMKWNSLSRIPASSSRPPRLKTLAMVKASPKKLLKK